MALEIADRHQKASTSMMTPGYASRSIVSLMVEYRAQVNGTLGGTFAVSR